MDKDWQKYLDLASGMKEATQKRAESIVRNLVKRGEIAAERAEKAVDELLAKSEANRKAIASIVRSETEKTADRLGLVRQRDLTGLERRIDALERQLGVAGTAKKSSSKKSAAKKSGAKKAGGKKSTAKKSAAAKRAGRTTAAKKATPPQSSPGDSSPGAP